MGKNGRIINFLIGGILITVCFNGQVYARTIIDEIVNRMQENQKLDREIVKLMRFELSNQVKNTSRIILKDNCNHLWMFKFYKSSFPVNNSIAAYQIAYLCGVQTPCIYEVMLPFNGKMAYGTVQVFIKNVCTMSDISPFMLSEKQIKMMQCYQVVDYFICNPDVGGDNYLMKLKDDDDFLLDIENKDIVGIDKDLSFYKRLNSPEDLLDDNDPYYNRIWDAYIEKKIDVDFHKSFQLIDYIQSIDAEEIEDLLKPFFSGRETFLKSIISRKEKLMVTFEKFYQELSEKRGESFQSQVTIEKKEEYAQIVLEKIKKIVLQKKKWLKSLQAKHNKNQKNIDMLFHREGFHEVRALEDIPRKNIDVIANKVLNELKTWRKNSLSIYEKFVLSLYLYEVENILRERPPELFLNEELVEDISKEFNDIDVFSLEYTFRTFYKVPRRISDKILKKFDYHSQDVLKHLSFIQSPINCEERKIIFAEYEKQIEDNSLVNFIGGMLFRKTKYLEKIKDNFYWKYLGKGMLYWLYEDGDKAIKEYRRAITLSDDKKIKFFGYRLLGFVYEHNSERVRFGKGFDVDKAVTNYKKALEIKSNSVETRLNLASLYLIKRIPEKALKEFKEIKKLVPQYGKEHFHFNKIKEESSYKDKKEYLKAVRTNTLSGRHHYIIGLAYLIKKDNELARIHFDKANEFGHEINDKIILK